MGQIRIECDDSQICSELVGETEDIAFHYLYANNPRSRIVASSPNFALVVDISPLIEGHCLLVPRHHYISFGHVPPSLWGELEEFEHKCGEMISREYGSFVLLEHGSSSTMASSPCISHAHWHIVPQAEKVFDVFHRDGLAEFAATSWRDLRAFAKRDEAYIYYKFAERHLTYLTENMSKRHQYLRVAIAELFDIPEPEWDWALSLKPELLRKTVARLTSC